MGYTHYWRNKVSFTDAEWNTMVERFNKEVLPFYDIAGPDSHGVPIVDRNKIFFNGTEKDGACESLVFHKKAIDFEFCKTRRLPYDAAVVKTLKIAREVHPQIQLSSDGGTEVFEN